MVQEIRGSLVVQPKQKYALVTAEFNSLITTRLADAAVDALMRHGATESQITKIWVPGSLELATTARQLTREGVFSAIICLGCIIRGQTSHFDHVATQTAAGIAAVGRETGVPTIFGVITAETAEQAMDRSGLKMGNIGWNGACAAIEMAAVIAAIKKLK